jgi:DNA-3-methyladenine glycosylase II
VMARLIERAGPLRIRAPRDPDPFVELAQAIAYQQLAGRAAAAIWGRVAAMFDGAMTPERVLATPDEAFRAAGFSGSKTRSVKDLADKIVAGVVPVDRLRRMPDDEVVARLSEVRGIGRWTAEMFLIFTLRRMDVWPVLDYGIRNGYRLAYGLPEMPTPKALDALGERFRPYRTVAAWYCWRAVELAADEAAGTAD